MKRVLYLCNYMTESIQKLRNNKASFSQAANNKVTGITKALLYNDCEVLILSSGLVNNKTGRFYPEVSEKIDLAQVIYAGMRDIPVLGSFSAAVHMYRLICRLHAEKKIDNIIFYNYKPEVALPALWAKKRLGIPITVEYEDGYSSIADIKGLKKLIFTKTEKIVSKKIDSAILVSAQLQPLFSVPTVVVRGVVNEDFYQECRNYKKRKNEKFTILYSGDLGKTRGVGVLYDALGSFKEDCRVVITGKGKLGANDPRIDFRGFVSYQEVKDLMKQADVLLQCQRTKDSFAQTSFPSKLFEYIATGNVIVSSAMDDVKRFAGDAIIYYENDDSKNLAESLEKAYLLYKKENNNEKIERLCKENLPCNVGKYIVEIL
ncbi:MAG: glycosyltransferase [Lachnospiraceae bacterium]|nr:glycosyltransferase [Lachnospiraceae bacterium]